MRPHRVANTLDLGFTAGILFINQPADNFYTIVVENFFMVGSLGQFGGQVLPGKMQVFMQVQPPFWAVGNIVYDAVEGDKFSRATLACAAFKLRCGDSSIGNHDTFSVSPSGR